jgi:hypothetical protein
MMFLFALFLYRKKESFISFSYFGACMTFDNRKSGALDSERSLNWNQDRAMSSAHSHGVHFETHVIMESKQERP